MVQVLLLLMVCPQPLGFCCLVRLLTFVRDVVHRLFLFCYQVALLLGGFNKTKVISPLFFFNSITVNLCLAFFQLVLQNVDHFPMFINQKHFTLKYSSMS